MAIDKSKIKLTIPAGLTQKGDITVNDAEKKATVVVTGKTVGVQEVSVSYNGGEAKEVTITVTAAPAFSGDPTATPATIDIGQDSVISQALTVDGVSVDDVTVTVPAGLTQKVAPAINGKTLTLTVTGKTAGAHDVTLEFAGATKTVTITVNALPAFVGEPVANPTAIEVGADVTITQEFDKAGVKVADVTLTPSAGLTLKTAAAISGTTLTVVYTGKTAGAQTVGIKYNGVTKTANVTVNEPTTLKSITADPDSVEVGKDSTITMQF